MGGAYNKLKEYQKAIDACKEAIKLKPDNGFLIIALLVIRITKIKVTRR
jgi:tetratricopeptide (TPR) repeat protein